MFKLADLLRALALIDPLCAIDIDALARFFGMANPSALGAQPSLQKSGAVAVLPIRGVLTPRASWYSTGMDQLRGQFDALGNDDEISAVAIPMDSPGGTVAGTPETAASLAALRAKKKVVVIADPMSASAAYWIGAQASEFVVTPGGDVGSIGVLARHIDLSQALANDGVKVTTVRSSPFKDDANPFEPLSEQSLAHYQNRVNAMDAQFVKDVAQGRRTTQADVRENYGQGRVLNAGQAVKAGMADRVATVSQVLAELAAGGKPPATRKRLSASLSFG